MRVLCFVLTALMAAACARTVRPTPTFRWQPRAEPRLGVRIDVAHGWTQSAVDDAILLTPAGEDDFAILVVRAELATDDAAALGRLGKLDRVSLTDTPIPGPRITAMRGGAGVLQPANVGVILQLARVRDTRGSGTFVGAIMSKASAARGRAAFDHVVQSLVLSEPTATARPALPTWLTPKKPDRHRGDEEMDDE